MWILAKRLELAVERDDQTREELHTVLEQIKYQNTAIAKALRLLRRSIDQPEDVRAEAAVRKDTRRTVSHAYNK